MRTARGLFCLALVLSCSATVAAAEEGFKPLFNGKDLAGWQGDKELWSVVTKEGTSVIVGSTEKKKLTQNSFLATEKSYKNFVLKIKFKLRNGNSGVQIRSKLHEDYRVTGYQPDIAESRYTGILYEEGGRGILADVKQEEAAKHFQRRRWNEYVITCDGPRIKQQLNGFTTVDYTEKNPEKGATEGIIALQLHVGAPMEIWFKDIQIKELP